MIYSSPYVYSFGKKLKGTDSCIESKMSENFPGPGAYQLSRPNTVKNNKTCSFGKDVKMKAFKSTTPGPGEYNKKNSGLFGRTTPHYSMGKNARKTPFDTTKDNATSEMGPGYYKTESAWITKPKTPCVKFLPSQKAKEIKKTPGPGQYESKEYFGKNNKTSKIGTSQAKRDTFFLKDNVNCESPGPGYYSNLRSSFDKKNAKITLRGKPNDIRNIKTPGPGEYNSDQAMLKMGKATPKFSLGKEDKNKTSYLANKNEMNQPGPGHYQSQSDFNHTKKKQIKAATFGKDPKNKTAKTSNIGPGYYKIPCAVVHVPDYVGGTFEEKFKYV